MRVIRGIFGFGVTACLAAGMLTAASSPASAATYGETTGGVAHTWTNYTNAGGYEGPQIGAYQTVQIACKLQGFTVADGNNWWYQIASAPWSYNYYVSADPFYNNGQTSGSLHGTPFFDPAVPDCGAPPPPTPQVTLAQGPAAPSGYRYAITLSGFPANSGIGISCRDSVDPGGFYSFTLVTNGNGQAFTQSYCYSGDGPDHWVIANGVESNHVSWSGVPAPPTSAPPPPPTSTPQVALAQGPSAPGGYWYAITLTGFTAGASVSVSCYDSVDPGGFRTFPLVTNGNGQAFTQNNCYSGDGPDHWVVANGTESNHVSWGGAGAPNPGGGSSGSGGNSGNGSSSNGGSGSTPPPNSGGPSPKPTSHGDPCLAAYGTGSQATHSIFGGSETDYNRASSLYQQCEGFGAPQGLNLSPQMKCALIGAAATFVGPGAILGASVCDSLGVADSLSKGDWVGAVAGPTCEFLADVFAKGVGIVVAGAASETGPVAVAVGVATYKGLAALLKVACGGLLDGGASALGQKLEADHETAIAVDIVRRGKCLHERRVFGLIFWSAASC